MPKSTRYSFPNFEESSDIEYFDDVDVFGLVTADDLNSLSSGGGLSGSDAVPDPNATTSTTTGPDLSLLTVDPSTLVQVPMNTPINTSPPDDQIVVYDMSRGLPSDSVGSWRYFDSNGSDGMMWHANPGEPPDFWAVRAGHGDRQTDKANLAASSEAFGWGPLVGNPNTDFKTMRWDKAAKRWFWFVEEAPSWSLALAQRQLAMTNASTQAAADAAAAAQAQLDATAQAQSDKADAQALHDQQQAQQAADAAAQVAATAQQSSDTADASALAKQQAQDASSQADVDRQTQQAQLDVDKQQAQVELQNQQAQNEINAKAAQAQLDLEAQQAQQALQAQQAMAASGIPPADPGQGQAGDEPDPFDDGSNMVPADDFS